MRSPTLSELPPPLPGKTGWPWTEQSPQLPDTTADDTPWPQVSIVTPSYNQGPFIEETIRSVLLQGYPNLEYIIIDGQSGDSSLEIIKKYEPWLDHWMSRKDKGQSAAINEGFSISKGDWLGWLNSDDCYAPGAIAELVRCAGYQHANFVAGACIHFGKEIMRRPFRIQPIPQTLQLDTVRTIMLFDQPACLWHRELFTRHGPLLEDFHYAFDWYFFINCLSSAHPAVTKDVVSLYRHHRSHKTRSGGGKRLLEIIRVYDRYLPDQYRLPFKRVRRWLLFLCAIKEFQSQHRLGPSLRRPIWVMERLIVRSFRSMNPLVWAMLGLLPVRSTACPVIETLGIPTQDRLGSVLGAFDF